MGRREVEGGLPGPSLCGSRTFFLLAECPAQARGLVAVFSCSVVGSFVFQDGPVGVYVAAGSWALGCQRVSWALPAQTWTKPLPQPEDPEVTPETWPASQIITWLLTSRAPSLVLSSEPG